MPAFDMIRFCNHNSQTMIALLQRVTEAAVEVNGETVATIGPGLLIFVAVEKGDTEVQAKRLAERVLSYRVFADQQGKMNLDVRQAGGELLLVPQFTLAADTNRGNRPSFTPAASPDEGQKLFQEFADRVSSQYPRACNGQFGADMKVILVNDGPVTFWLQAN
jgi:D-tyrosyl-tRNA(Tyr) deacylase